MLEMDQYEHIRIMERHYHKSIRQISRETGHHRRTIRKALAGLTPGYRRKVALKQPVMGQYEKIITDWLTTDRAVPRKQRHTAKRVFDRLVAEYGFQGAASSVRKRVREVKQELGLLAGEAMVPLEATMGEAEMDWGDLIVILNGEKTRLKMFCMRSRYSGKPFVRLYRNERQQMLFDGHMHAFAYFGGVFPTIIYDNLTTVVKQVLRGGRRVEQRDFQHFRSYYSFRSKFCNVARGNEKGGVEGLVKFSRQNFLVPIPELESLAELNQKLLEQCDLYTERVLGGRETRQTVAAMAEEERKVLMTLLPPYETAVYRSAKVDNYQMIQVEGNRYSVPGRVGKTVHVSLGC